MMIKSCKGRGNQRPLVIYEKERNAAVLDDREN